MNPAILVNRRRRRGGGLRADLPPNQQPALVLAFDPAVDGTTQTGNPLFGPAYTLGATSGVDASSDPTRSAGPPALFTFGAGKYIDFGDVLDSAFMNGAGFAVIAGAAYVVAQDSGVRFLLSKFGAVDGTMGVGMLTGRPYAEVYDGAGQSNFETFTATSAVTEARHVLAWRYDPTQPRGSRITVYVDGSPVAGSASTGGTGSSVPNSAAALRMGTRAAGDVDGVNQVGPVYAYAGALSNGDVAANSTYIAAKGWP